jgi:hypothetical protein
VRMQKSWLENTFTAFSYANGIIHTNLWRKNGLWTVNFIKRWLRDWSLKFIALDLSFRKVCPCIFCMTMHRHILRASSRVFGEIRDPCVIPSTLLPWFSAGWPFFIYWIKKCNERGEIRGCFIDPADCDERTEGDREDVFSRARAF